MEKKQKLKQDKALDVTARHAIYQIALVKKLSQRVGELETRVLPLDSNTTL